MADEPGCFLGTRGKRRGALAPELPCAAGKGRVLGETEAVSGSFSRAAAAAISEGEPDLCTGSLGSSDCAEVIWCLLEDGSLLRQEREMRPERAGEVAASIPEVADRGQQREGQPLHHVRPGGWL